MIFSKETILEQLNHFPEFGLIKSKFYELIYDIDFIGKKVMVKDLIQSILA